MRKVLLIAVLSTLLVGCNDTKIHENVNEEVATDALQLMDAVVKNVDKGVAYEDADSKDVVDNYYDKYMGRFSTKKDLYDKVNEDILIIANATAARYKEGISLETEKEELKEDQQQLKEFVSTGQGYEEYPEPRKGVSSEFVNDSLEVVELIDYLVNDLDYGFDDLEEEDTDIIFSYSERKYLNEDEEFSATESNIYSAVEEAISFLLIQGEELEYGIADHGDEIRELKEEVQILAKGYTDE